MSDSNSVTVAGVSIPKKGWKTYAVAVVTALLSVASGLDWSEFLSPQNMPEKLAAIAAGIAFARALVSLFRAMGNKQ